MVAWKSLAAWAALAASVWAGGLVQAQEGPKPANVEVEIDALYNPATLHGATRPKTSSSVTRSGRPKSLGVGNPGKQAAQRARYGSMARNIPLSKTHVAPKPKYASQKPNNNYQRR